MVCVCVLYIHFPHTLYTREEYVEPVSHVVLLIETTARSKWTYAGTCMRILGTKPTLFWIQYVLLGGAITKALGTLDNYGLRYSRAPQFSIRKRTLS